MCETSTKIPKVKNQEIEPTRELPKEKSNYSTCVAGLKQTKRSNWLKKLIQNSSINFQQTKLQETNERQLQDSLES